MRTMVVDNSFDPILIVNPFEGARIGQQSPIPFEIDSGVNAVPSDFGQAWDLSGATDQAGLIVPISPVQIKEDRGTLILRYRVKDATTINSVMSLGENIPGESFISLSSFPGGTQTQLGYRTVAEAFASFNVPTVAGVWTWIAVRWSDHTLTVNTPTYQNAVANHHGGPYRGLLTSGYPGMSDLLIDSFVMYDRVLSLEEVESIGDYFGQLTWGTSRIERVEEIEYMLPDYTSSIYAIGSEVFVTDRFNTEQVNVSNAITDVSVDMDVDRFGGKSRCAIEAFQAAVRDGDWVAPYLTLTPEVGDEVRSQMGHFFLGAPDTEYDGTGGEYVSISGVDHVQLLADSSLLSTLYTPVDGYVMGDVEFAIRSLGITSMGPNLLVNGDFENGMSGWGEGANVSHPHTNLFTQFETYAPASGNGYWGWNTAANAPINTDTYLSQPITVPSGTTRLLFSALAKRLGTARQYVFVVAKNSAGADVYHFSPASQVNMYDGWCRLYVSLPVVEEYRTVTAVLLNTYEQAGPAWGEINFFDDARLSAITGDLLPKSMLSLPPSSTRATSRIQHTIEDSLYTAVNDRLTGISMQGIQVSNVGVFTTRASRDIENDQPKRIYQLGGDSQIVGDVSIRRSTNNRYNRVVVVKESYEGDDLWAIATNENPDDKWSVINSPVRTQYVSAQAATDQESVDLLARQFLGRASMQEDLSISVLPDPEITAYDTIRVEGEGAESALGNWGLQSVDWGMTAENPLVRLGARRTLGSRLNVS